MNQEINTDNRIFIFAFTGALLFIAAFSYTLANFSNIAMLQLSSVAIASVLVISSVSLLYRAIKKDKDRLERI